MLRNVYSTWQNIHQQSLLNIKYLMENKTRLGSPIDRRLSDDEAPPIGKIHPFSKLAVTLEPVMQLGCALIFRIS